LIDAGMGTGTWLEEMASTCRVLGLDDHEESLEIARPVVEAAGGQVRKSSLESIDLESKCATVVTAMDVLEHIEDDGGTLRELWRLLKPGGVLILTVPALPFLWSDWDESLHHFRRYRKQDLARIIEPLNAEVVRLSYFNASAIVPVWFVRTWRKLRKPKSNEEWAEHRVPGPFWNRVLYAAMVVPAKWGWFRPPLGVSLLVVLRKPQS
jgi:2-polyprenyl-3-methyl-5-hydroxy-6-metoxy-1,4-benzoquinol methylase